MLAVVVAALIKAHLLQKLVALVVEHLQPQIKAAVEMAVMEHPLELEQQVLRIQVVEGVPVLL
jgi:hypothetical protein